MIPSHTGFVDDTNVYRVTIHKTFEGNLTTKPISPYHDPDVVSYLTPLCRRRDLHLQPSLRAAIPEGLYARFIQRIST